MRTLSRFVRRFLNWCIYFALAPFILFVFACYWFANWLRQDD